jgi:peptidoglycan hydrolase CwlO-like protein
MTGIESFIYPAFMGLFSVIGYFLRETMADMKKTKERLLDLRLEVNSNKSELEVLKNDHQNKYENMVEKFDELKEVMRDLSREIKTLTLEFKKKD